MHSEIKLILRSHSTSYCLIEVVTEAEFTVYVYSMLPAAVSPRIRYNMRLPNGV
jgi:hypothetical protein